MKQHEQSLLDILPFSIIEEYGEEYIIEHFDKFNSWVEDTLYYSTVNLKYYLINKQ